LGVFFRTFGCKANQYDTERMRQELEALGVSVSPEPGEAHLCIVNTCTVTNQADADARRFIKRYLRENPEARVVVAGCSSALRPQAYWEMDGVVGVVEGHDPVEVARTALPALVDGGVCGPEQEDHGPSFNPTDLLGLRLGPTPRRKAKGPLGGRLLRRRAAGTRAWLKIQDGCDRKCSFCATRLARGDSRSRGPAEVLAEARLLARSHPELVLTGIHIGHYGRDLEEPASLSRLLALLLENVPDVRFRLGSVEATEVDELLLELLADSDHRLARHLHMPLQSGSNSVLRRMRRWHTREAYRRRTLEILERVPVLGFGADVITGFPGEEDRDHQGTRDLVDELPFTYLHVFPFSPRGGTAAADLPDSVPQRVAGERARELRDLAIEKGRRYREGRVGTEAWVVPEGSDLGLTGDYLRVSLENCPDPGRSIHSGVLEGSGEHLRIDLAREGTPI
jgi:threonylcarbamoyladenosine tRNA methylthiotransferase MtaB